MQKLKNIWAQKTAPKVPEWPGYENFGKVTQNPHFLKKRAKGVPREIFKKSPKKLPSLMKPQKTLRQMALSSNKYALIAPRLEKILVQNTAPKMPEWQSYGKFRKVTLNPHFSERVERGDQGKFFKNRPKSSPRLKGKKHTGANSIILYLGCTTSAKTGEDLGTKSGSKKYPNGQVMAIFARSPKTCIFWKSAKGGPREIFQKSPKK